MVGGSPVDEQPGAVSDSHSVSPELVELGVAVLDQVFLPSVLLLDAEGGRDRVSAKLNHPALLSADGDEAARVEQLAELVEPAVVVRGVLLIDKEGERNGGVRCHRQVQEYAPYEIGELLRALPQGAAVLPPVRVEELVEQVPRMVRPDTRPPELVVSPEEGEGLEHAPEPLSLIHISEPTRLLSISYAVFCLKKKKIKSSITNYTYATR
eukprot:TRINITY_DN24399_c0_g2_i1.p1 TRINITY_DN24399_c0_g2~~TRINITY_DN24399_c0_g2_i1.p1  ORF type:complete len:210 (+),score=33.14 TRINITY_DN24399_c0_g2_i1:746-1375(+)